MAKNSKLKESVGDLKKSSIETISGLWKTVKWTAKTIYNLFRVWYRSLEVWDKKIAEQINKKERSKFVKWISDKILRLTAGTALTVWLLVWTPKINNKTDTEKTENKITALSPDDKVFWIDVSEYNWSDVEEFIQRSEIRFNSEKEDVRWPSFVYIRWKKEKEIDSKAETHLKTAQKFKNNMQNKDFYVWTYAYFDKSIEWMSDKWIEKQVDVFIKVFNTINNKEDNLWDLTPMLDFEFRWRYPTDNTKKEQYKKAVLKWLQKFEEKTWVKPGIYTWAALYKDYFLEDERFASYPNWIADYRWSTHVNQDKSTITQLGKEFNADIIQFTENITWSGMWNHEDHVDWNSALKKNFDKLIIE